MDEKLKNLLQVDSKSKPLLSHSLISQVKNTLRNYIASPWNPILKKVISEPQYLAELKRFISQNFSTTQEELCKPGKTFSGQDPEKPYQDILCQSHAGNLLEHSQWAALQIMKWNHEGNSLTEGMDITTLVVSAFFHDIGKAGDCITTCSAETHECWHDMYAVDKYDKQGDPVHPSYCGDLILGKKMFYTDCKCMGDECGINIKTMIEDEFPSIDIRVVALTAYMHWEFGKLNMPVDWSTGLENPMICRLNTYMKEYVKWCKVCGLEPTNITYLKLCIAVSCADIAAGTNVRLLPNVDGIIPAKTIYLGKDPWTLFGMDLKYDTYRSELLTYFKKVFPDTKIVVSTPEKYKKTFSEYKSSHSVVSIQNLVGRVLRGKQPEDFINLSPDPSRKLIILMNSDGLQILLGKPLPKILDTIGYPRTYAEDLIRDGTEFKLLVASKSDQILPGTWDNLLVYVSIIYMNTNIPQMLSDNLPTLKDNSFKDGYGRIMEQMDKQFTGKMTTEILNSSGGSLWMVRLFLNDVLGLNKLYMGDGFTYTEDGQKGLAEYFALNQSIHNLRDVVLIDLN